MKIKKLSKLAVLSITMLAVLGSNSVKAKDISVKEIGSYFVGGEEVSLNGLPITEVVYTKGGKPEKSDPNGQFEVGQMYVQFVKLSNPKAKYPLMMWHGGGFTGTGYESTPDGRPGWQSYFLKAGHNVYISDAVERGRASWAKYPEINQGPPLFRTKEHAWTQFRIGKIYNGTDKNKSTIYEDQKFPAQSFDNMVKSGVPRWITSDKWTQKAYNDYVAGFNEGVVIIAHSQAGNFAVNAALANPGKVKALILIEPSGAPDPDKFNIAGLKDIPHLYIWGDYLDKPEVAGWAKYSHEVSVPKYSNAIKNIGGDVTWIDLPQVGIKGNSHMIFMDKNSDDIANIINKWMKAKGFVK